MTRALTVDFRRIPSLRQLFDLKLGAGFTENGFMGALKIPQAFRTHLQNLMSQRVLSVPADLTFQVAENFETLLQAFTLMHDCFVQQGLMKERPSGLWLSKFNALPTTKILTVTHDETVVGALAVIQKSAFGLPAERDFMLPQLPFQSKMAQVTAVAVHKDFESRRNEIQQSLLKYACHVSVDYLGVTHLVMASSVPNYKFFQSLCELTSLKEKNSEKKLLRAGVIDIRKLANFKTDFANFLQQLDEKQMQFPENSSFFSIKPYLNNDSLRILFCEQTEIFNQLNDFDKLVLKELYPTSEELQKLSSENTAPYVRRERRFEIRLHTEALDGSVQVEIQNVALHGLGGVMSEQVPLGKCSFNLELGDGQNCEVEGQILWQTPQGYFGFSMQSPPFLWRQYIENLESNLAVG